MDAIEQNGDQAMLHTGILDILCAAEEGDADLNDLLTLLWSDDLRNVVRDELEVSSFLPDVFGSFSAGQIANKIMAVDK